MGWWDMVLPWPCGSIHPAHSRQQLLERNHAVTEPGGEFQLDKSLKAKGNEKETRGYLPDLQTTSLLALGDLSCDSESDKTLSQQWGELQAPAWHVGEQKVC